MRACALGLLLLAGALAVLVLPGSARSDPNPPTVTLTSPTSGADDLRSAVTLTADATAGTNPIDHVEFYYTDPNSNGGNPVDIGGDSTAPYRVTFDTTTVPNCELDVCELSAVAFDTQTNQSNPSTEAVGVDNPIVVDPSANDGSDSCSLRNAIASATNNDSEGSCLNGLSGSPDTIEVPAGTYDLNSELEISSDLNIVGAGAHSVTVQAPTVDRAVEVDGSANAGISGVTIAGGRPTAPCACGGGILVDSGASLSLQDAIVTGGDAINGGGIENDGSLVVDGSTIEHNSAEEAGTGGGIDDFGSSLSITNSTIMRNTADGDGGGLYFGGADTPTLTNDTIANNATNNGSGGGLAVGQGDTVDLANTLLAQNLRFESPNDCSGTVTSLGNNLADRSDCNLTASGDQQGVADTGIAQTVDSAGPTDVIPLTSTSPAIGAGNLMDCPLADQRDAARTLDSSCDVGAYEYTSGTPSNYIVSTVGELDAALSTFFSVDAGGTIQLDDGHYDIGNLIGFADVGGGITIDGRGAADTILDGNGSGPEVVEIEGGNTSTIKDVTVENSSGDGIYDDGDLAVDNSVLWANTGAGIESVNQGLDVSGSAVYDNGDPQSSAQNNAGIYSEAPLTVVNSTITGNNGSGVYGDFGGMDLQNATIADNSGVGLELHTSPTTAVDTIIAGNTSSDCAGTLDDWQNRVNDLDSDSSCGLLQPGDVHADPKLGPLRDNGGPTPTMALLPGSPAVDAGDDASCATTDQREVTRPQGAHCDIGAFEFVPSGTIAFESNRTGNSQIWTMNPDGSNPVQLTHDGPSVTDSLPSISPDGHTVVYQSDASGTIQIWAINGDGTDPHQLTSVGANTQPTFSPDGTQIAFDSDRTGHGQLFVMNADGSGQTQVTNSNGIVGGSSWNPTATQIAVNDNSSGTSQIYKVDVANGNETGPLTSAGVNRNPHWSPDGSKILYSGTNCACVENVFVMDADGTNQHDVTQGGGFDTDPAWSPDGSQIAFLRDPAGCCSYNIYTANADGSNPVDVTNDPAQDRNSFPNWGTRVSAPDLVVNTTVNSDDGACTPALCSLTDAINAANAAGGGTINFQITGGTGPYSIDADGGLPAITAPTTIDGFTQPGALPNTQGFDQGDNASLQIVLVDAGLTVDSGGAGSVIRGLSFTNPAGFGTAIDVEADNVTVAGNYIGLGPDGKDDGVTTLTTGVLAAGSNDVIGGPHPADRNVVGFADFVHPSGIDLSSGSGTLVQGNYIGTDATGVTQAPNDVGIGFLDGATGDTIRGNLISGNNGDGIDVTDPDSTGNTIVGNLIGTTADGMSQLANGGDGVFVATDDTTIGGTGNGDGNVISGNSGDGVFVHSSTGVNGTQVVGNLVGVDASGANVLGNGNNGVELDNTHTTTVQGNVLSGNGVLSPNPVAGLQVTGLTTDTHILGNKIGTTADGTGALGNGNGSAGIYLGGVDDTTIGGPNSADANVISGNSGDGIDDGGNGTQIDGNVIGLTSDGTTALGNDGLGIYLYGGQTHTVQDNVVSSNTEAGLLIDGASDSTILGNLVGTDATGSHARGNDDFGIEVAGGSGTIIGGTGPSDGNVISANSSAGIEVDSGGGTTIQGNFIGTDATGSSALGNDDDGIYVSVSGNTIGGDTPGAGNVISGNTGTGVHLEGSSANGNTVSGNLIGTDAAGTQPLGNEDDGVLINAGAGNNTIGGTDAGAANVIADNGAAPSLGYGGGVDLVFGPGSGNVVEGNLIGTDLSGSSNLGNAHFGVKIDGGSNQTIGGTGVGNTIAFNNGPGIVDTNTSGDDDENVFSQNSIHDNTGRGIELDNGANDGIVAPTISSVAGNQASGTLTDGSGAHVTIEFFGNATCADATNGAGRDFLGSKQVTAQGANTPWTATLSGLGSDEGVTATITDTTPDTSEFSNCVTVGGAGTLSGQVSTSQQQNANLTTLGTQDWAVWGYANGGTSTSLAPDVRKAGGSGISDLTDLHTNSAPLRGLGQFGQADEPFSFNWADGTVPTTATGAIGGLEHDGQPGLIGTNGDGFSFTVPADTTQRTLTIYTSAHWATGTLTATLSDGSAPQYTQTVTSTPGDAQGPGDNDPGVFTIQYAAASSGQQLKVDWVETNPNCPSFGCDDAAIYAVALAGPGSGSVSGVSAGLGSDSSVAISGSVPTSDVPLAAFDPQPPGAPPITINGLQLANTQLANTQLANTQLANTQLANTQLANTQLANTQLANTQLANTQLANTQLANTQLANTQLANTQLANTQLANTQLAHTQLANTGLPLNTVPLNSVLYPNGWAGLLQGTTLDGQPLQTITLHDVLALTPADVPHPPLGKTADDVIAAIQGLSFASIELPSSSLGQVTVGALALGGALVNQLGGDLQSAIESQLASWCQGFVRSTGASSGFCDGSDPGIGYLSLIQLGLLGAPVASLQLANTQLANTQLANTQLANTQLANTQLANTQLANTPLSTSASGIVGMQLAHTDLGTGFGIDDLVVGALPSGVQNALFFCSTPPSNFNCATGTLGAAQAAGAIRPGTTLGDLDQGGFLDHVTIAQLLATVLGPNSAYAPYVNFGDLVGLFLQNTDVNWESLTPSVLALFDPNRPQLAMNADFTVQGTGTPSADVKIALPAGFDYVPGSATLTSGPAPGDPTVTNTGSGVTLDWHLDSVNAGQPYQLDYSVYGGTAVGATQATETITAGGQSTSSIRSFSVTDSNPNSSATNPAPIDTTPGHDTVEMSTLPTAGAVDYYSFPMPAAGTRIQVHLTNLPADYDLALYSPRTTSVRTTTNLAPPLQDGVVPDTQVNLNNGSSGQLAPTGLEDVPDPGIPLVQLSDNRHTDDEDAGMVSPGGGGVVTIAVFGYNGAFSPDAYTLRVRETAPPATAICAARTFPDAGQGSTPDSLPSSLPSNLNTIILVDEKRLGDTYGSGAETTALGKLHDLAGDGSLGVSGVVVPVEKIAGVQTLYNTWDSNPCDPSAANAVANPIADEVDAIVAARPGVKYVVFAGGDDQIPFFRLPDLSLVANENGFAGQFAPNEYQGSLAAGDLLSDDPYLDTQPVPASGQQLFPPNLAGGRLVETPQEIADAITNFEHAPTPGALKSSTGFVSGYDFVADGSQSVADNLTDNGVNVRTLDNPLSATSDWGTSAFLAAAFPAGGPADINSWNGHYDNTRTQLANGDILSTSQLPTGLNGGVFFTMGCHAGFQTTDAVVGSTVLDWPQYMAQHDTGFVGNTGFGLGDTDSVAFSEALMADFAGQLSGSNTLGSALLQAKQQYYLSRVAFSNYDEKALSEAELYGLPMYGIGQAPRALAAFASSSPDPVHGASNSTSPSQGTLSSFPGNSVQSANFAATPDFSKDGSGQPQEQHGQDGDYFTNVGQVQAPNYRPLQPYLSLTAGRTDSPGLLAHGVVIDTLTSQDQTPFTPDNVRPTLNSSADEPPPTFTDQSWPEKIPTLVSLGQNQNVNLATGQFFTQTSGSTTTGVERLWTQINGRVTYSTSQDFTPPTIDSIDAFESDSGHPDDILGFTGRFSDLDQNGNPGTVVFAQVVYDDGTGHWQALQLQRDPVSGLWSAGIPFAATHVQYFVEACDAAGNCGYSSNKGNYFDAQPLPPASGTGGSSGAVTISPDHNPNTGSWYRGSLTVTASTTADSATAAIVSVDGVPLLTPSAGPITLSGDGAHVVVARDSAGNTATAAYLIDTTGPTITHAISPAAPDGANGWYTTAPTVSFACADNLSGVKTCGINGGPSTQTTLSSSSSAQSVTASATDTAGNASGPVTVSGIKVDTSGPTGGSISVGAAAYNATGSVAVSVTNASDPESGIASNKVQRKLATLSGGTCGAFDATWSDVSLVSGKDTVASGKCVEYQLVATNNAGLSTVYSTGVVKVDTTGPTGGAISVTPGYNTTGSVPVSVTNATDPESGVTSNQVQRKLAALTGGNCGSFAGTWSNVTLSGGNDTVPSGNCVEYQLSSTNGAGLTATSNTTGVVKVDTTGPTGGSISVTPGYNTTGSVAVTVTNASDPDSGITNQVQRKQAPLTNGSCGTFDATWSNVSLVSGKDTVASGKCVQYQLVSTNGAGVSTTLGPTGTVKVDTSAPTGGAISVTAGFSSTNLIAVAVTNASDPESGITSNQVQRKLATLSGGNCGTFDANWSSVSLSGGTDTVPLGKCVEYQLVAIDNAGLQTTYGPTGIVKVRLNPTITWNPPATILFGTKLSSTQLNATANVPGTFVYTPAAGTLLQPGVQTLLVTFTPTSLDYNVAAASRMITVGFSQACLTGSLSGSLTIKSGNAYCIQGGKVSGSITVQSGGSLYVSGGSISGSITATGATALTMCGTSVSGSTSISSSSGLVELGGPSGSGCAANKLSGAVTLSGNTAGVTAVGDTISGPVTASSNQGGVLFSGNKVSGAITVNGNSGGVTFTNNTVSGNVTITNNTGGFTFSGNTISGIVTLKNNS